MDALLEGVEAHLKKLLRNLLLTNLVEQSAKLWSEILLPHQVEPPAHLVRKRRLEDGAHIWHL
jgi:hypothetical protein